MSIEAAEGSAARVLADAVERNGALGHDNLGSLSESHGFVSARPPAHDLPAPHDEWVAVADELPELVSTLRLRRSLDALPVLDASTRSLEDRNLLRASSVISILSQAYNNVPLRPPAQLPEQLAKPWLQISDRLDRPPWTFTTVDFISHNWRFVDPRAQDPFRAENLELINDIWDHPQMTNFMVVSMEVHAASAPLVGCAVRAEAACRRRDDEALKAELALAAETVRRITHETLPKISPNARSGRWRVDPVLWAKLFAMLPLPLKSAPNVLNASGIELPTFAILDNLLGRRAFKTELGAKAHQFRNHYPRHWRDFLAAVADGPVAGYARSSGNRELVGHFDELSEAYQGRHGLLARHRLAAFGFMDAAFKSGRPSTVTGFSGVFEARAWETVDASFEAARLERLKAVPPARRFAGVESVEEVCPGVRRVVFDVRGLGLHCQPGDRLAVMPANDPDLVARTLRALRATGDELVDLTPEWAHALSLRPGSRAGGSRARVGDVLAFGHIRPVPRATAKLLHALTYDASLRSILEARTEDQWELWDLLELMAVSGFTPQRLWRAERGDYESLCRVVPPLQPRLYSVSTIEAGPVAAERIELTVGELAYDSVDSAASVARRRQGTTSTFLCRTIARRPDAQVPVAVVRPVAFSLPADPAIPIVMFAGGTGIAPFREFLRVRTATDGTQNVMLAGAASREALPYREELEDYDRRARAEVHFAYSRDPDDPRRIDDLVRDPGIAARLRGLLDQGALVYVCGRATFSRTVMTALAEVLAEPGRPGRDVVRDLVAQRRYMQDVFTTYTGSAVTPRPRVDASELARRRTREEGIWQAIAGRVYDLTEFEAIHPGGHKIIESFSGMDATSSYRIVEHHRDPEVEAMLAMYEVGVMRRLDFGTRFAIAVGEHGLEHLPLDELYRRWVRSLYALVEIANAHRIDVSARDEPLSRREYDGTRPPTAYRLQFGIESHARFLAQTLPMVCRRFAALWRTTSGPCCPGESFRALDEVIEQTLAGGVADEARAEARALERMLEEDPAAGRLADRIAAVTAADAHYLDAAKTLVASGVKAFEAYEGDVLDQGAELLLAPLRAFPSLTRDHFAAVAT